VSSVRAKWPIIILALVSVGLVVVLLIQRDKATKEKRKDTERIEQISNSWVQTSTDLNEQKKVNIVLDRDLTNRTEDLNVVSNNLVAVRETLAKTEAAAAAAAQQAKEEMAKRDAKIASLESEKDDLTKRMMELNTSITSLEGKIAATEKKLAASEGDREFLLKELKRLQAEKAELERQFNDLAILREQVRKLKDELSIARRLDWIRRGLYGSNLKGAEKLQKGFFVPVVRTNYDLNVELTRQGEVKVKPPATNAPAATPPAPK